MHDGGGPRCTRCGRWCWWCALPCQTANDFGGRAICFALVAGGGSADRDASGNGCTMLFGAARRLGSGVRPDSELMIDRPVHLVKLAQVGESARAYDGSYTVQHA